MQSGHNPDGIPDLGYDLPLVKYVVCRMCRKFGAGWSNGADF